MAIFLVVERTSSPFFQSCINDQQNAKSNSATKEQPASYGTILTSYVNCSGRFIEGHSVGITALATIIIAAFTCTLWIATSQQAQLTREALVADKRAFVFPTGFRQYWELDQTSGHYNWRFRPVWRNNGDTPTKRMRLHVACELRNTPLPQNFDFNYVTTNIGTGLLGPKYENEGGLAPMPPHQPAITAQDIIDVQNGRKFLYLMGWTRYFDVFPKTPERITRFCWIVIPNGNPLAFIPNSPEGSPHALTFGYLHFPRGNCADEECDN
jgi:hypothetical protein